MKKIFTLIGAALISASTLNAQTPVEQGNFIIDPYIGLPNWANSIIYNQYDGTSTSVENYKVNGGMLSYGGRFEYMVADNFGVGLDVNYEVSGFNYDYTDSIYDGVSGTYDVNEYNFDYKAKKLRAMARLNYHFVQNDRVDVYAGFAGGYKYVNRAIITSDPDYDDSEATGALVPVAFRIAIGTRVYFTDNIGAMIELGAFGGGLIQFGLSAKF
jgi:hypothetical protein